MLYNFHMGATLRCYGNVEIEAESIEAAMAMLTADFIADKFEITETTTDSAQDLAVVDISDAKTSEDLGDGAEFDLPANPYDPSPVPTFWLREWDESAADQRPWKCNAKIEPRAFYLDATSPDGVKHEVGIEVGDGKLVVHCYDAEHDEPLSVRIGAADITTDNDRDGKGIFHHG